MTNSMMGQPLSVTEPKRIVHDKRPARLNLIRHLLDHVPYRKVAVDLPKIPKAQPQPKGSKGGLLAAHIVPNRC
jgi:polyphosphate kinase